MSNQNNPIAQALQRNEMPQQTIGSLTITSGLTTPIRSSKVLKTNAAGQLVDGGNSLLTYETLTDNKTLALTDANKVFINNSTSNYTVTLPDKDVVNFPIGTTIKIYRQNTGTLALSLQSDEFAILGGGTLAVSARYGSITIEKVASGFWMVTGNTTP
jgi:hypothetical protein